MLKTDQCKIMCRERRLEKERCKRKILFIYCVVCLCVCLSVEVSILGFRTSTDRRTGPLCIFQMALPKVNIKVFLFFFWPFFGGLPKDNIRVFFIYYYCFFLPLLAGCLGLTPGFYYYYYFFPPLTDDPTQAIAFKKIKNMTNLIKQCKGTS